MNRSLIINNRIKNYQLLVKLVQNNLRLKYRYLFFGFLWNFFVPLFMACILMAVFYVVLRVDIKDYPFFIYLMTGLFPWRYFQESVTQAATSIVDNQNMLHNFNFPYELIPIAVVLGNLISFIPSLGVMVFFIWVFKVKISLFIFLLPLVLLLHTVFIIGIALFCSAVYVRFRDTSHIIEIFFAGMFYLTPVFYSLRQVSACVPGFFFHLYLLNPFVAILDFYRLALLDGYARTLPPQVNFWNAVWIPLVIVALVLCGGIYIFRKTKVKIPDYLSRYGK